jgi:hypothetical protein
MSGLHAGRRRSRRWSRGQKILVLGACLLAWGPNPRPACSATLADLFNGGTLTAVNSRFSNWQLISLDSTAAIPNLAQISVNALVNDPMHPGLQFVANGQLSTTGINSIDLVLKFRVDALAGSNTFTGHELQITGLSFGGSGEVAYVSEEVAGGPGVDLGSALVISDNASDFLQLVNSASFAPRSQVFVVMNVFVTGTSSIDAANLSTFTHRISQTGPAGKPGDYNQNGTVDAADYTVWRDHLGNPAGTLPNDINGGVIGQAQYNTWAANFGMSGSASSSAAQSSAVPEPAAAVLVFVAATASCLWRRRS